MILVKILFQLIEFIGVVILLYLIARFSPYEWTANDSKESILTLKNQFTGFNCIWYVIGLSFLQYTDVNPKALSVCQKE